MSTAQNSSNHVIYDNEVLSAQVTDITNTIIDVFPLMTVDRSLEGHAGMKKVINTYVYSGASEKLAMGEGNTSGGQVSFEPKEWEVALFQQNFHYFDEQVMQDPMVVSVGVEGASKVMSNEMKQEFFNVIQQTTSQVEVSKMNYDAVVDAIATMNVEKEEGLFLLINPSHKATLRKDTEFKAVGQGELLVTGHIGSICGIPVIVSKLVTDPVVATKKAVTCFFKKQSEAEQERDANIRRNDVYLRRVCLIALTDETEAVKIVVA